MTLRIRAPKQFSIHPPKLSKQEKESAMLSLLEETHRRRMEYLTQAANNQSTIEFIDTTATN